MFIQISAFQSLPPVALERLSEQSTITQYVANSVLYQQQDVLTGTYVIVSGYVKLYRQSRERIQILAILRDEDFFGTESLADNAISSSYAATMTSSTLIHIPAQAIHTLLATYPQFRAEVLYKVTDRLRQFAQLVHNLAFRDVTARLAKLLVTRAELDGYISVDGIHIPRIMTQTELATVIGTSREVVQRTFKKFSQLGLIEVTRKDILILDIEKLRTIADEENR